MINSIRLSVPRYAVAASAGAYFRIPHRRKQRKARLAARGSRSGPCWRTQTYETRGTKRGDTPASSAPPSINKVTRRVSSSADAAAVVMLVAPVVSAAGHAGVDGRTGRRSAAVSLGVMAHIEGQVGKARAALDLDRAEDHPQTSRRQRQVNLRAVGQRRPVVDWRDAAMISVRGERVLQLTCSLPQLRTPSRLPQTSPGVWRPRVPVTGWGSGGRAPGR